GVRLCGGGGDRQHAPAVGAGPPDGHQSPAGLAPALYRAGRLMDFRRLTPYRTPAVHRVGDRPLTKALVIGGVVLATVFVLIAPLAVIFIEAFRAGLSVYVQNLADPATTHAI